MSELDYRKQIKAQLEAIVALGQAVKEAKQIPAGTLYAVCCGVMTLEVFDKCIDYLVKAGVVVRHPSHLLEWIGGA